MDTYNGVSDAVETLGHEIDHAVERAKNEWNMGDSEAAEHERYFADPNSEHKPWGKERTSPNGTAIDVYYPNSKSGQTRRQIKETIKIETQKKK